MPDHYTLRAKKEGYPARSVYKLEEIQKKFRIFRPGQTVLDVGAAPGSWTLYILRQIKESGSLTAVDLNPLSITGNFPAPTFLQGDIFSREIAAELSARAPYNVIVSDAAPSTTGNRTVDTGRSHELVRTVMELSERYLKKGGALAVKVFQGSGDNQIFLDMRKVFNQVKRLKPAAVRKESFEIYFIGQDYKGL